MHSRHRSFMSCANVGASGFCHPPLRLEFGEHTLPRRRVEIHVKRDTTMISAGWNGMEWTGLEWNGLVGAELASGAVGGILLDGMLHAECCCLVLPSVPLERREICSFRWYYCENISKTGNCKG